MKRSQPLQRHTRLRSRPKRKRERHDPAYLRFVRSMACVNCGQSPPSEASHVTVALGVRGVAMKVPDRDAVPMCRFCHRAWDGRSYAFKGMTKAERMEQARKWVAAVQLWATPETLEQGQDLQRLGLGRLECHDGKWSWIAGPDTRERVA